MKKSRFLIITLLVLALLIGAYFLVSTLTKEEAAPEEEGSEAIVVVDDSVDYIISINYENELGSASYVKQGESWKYSVDQTMPINQEFVQTMADSLIKVTALRDITGKGDTSSYGFDDPSLSLTVGTKGGKTRSYVVGAYNDVSQGYYLKYNENVYVIDSAMIDATSHTLFDALITTELKEIEAESIISLTVNGEAGNTAGYANIGITTPENYKDKEKYGFDGSENKVEIKYNEETDITDASGNVTSTVSTERSYSFSYVTDGSISYVMLPDDPVIYQATGLEALTQLQADVQDTAELPETAEITQ